MSDFMLLGILRMPIEADDGVVAFTQFRSAARSAADRIEQLTAERDRLRGGIEYVLDGYGLSGPDYRFQDGEDGDWITDHLISVIKGETP